MIQYFLKSLIEKATRKTLLKICNRQVYWNTSGNSLHADPATQEMKFCLPWIQNNIFKKELLKKCLGLYLDKKTTTLF